MKIAFLGPQASFTGLAAGQLFPYEDLLPQPTIPGCFQALENGTAERAVVPLENSIEGTVSMTLDYLYGTPGIRIEAEAAMPIAHHLLVHPDCDATAIEKIYSHPQALAQTFHFLDSHFKAAEKQEFSSTAAAAKYVSEHPARNLAAVANQAAAELYGLKTLHRNIQDREPNHTRFIVISKNRAGNHHTGLTVSGRKSGLLITLPEDHAGGLHQVLSVFAWRKMNLSKIESRTLKTGLGNYFFFITVTGNWNSPLHHHALEELAALDAKVTFLGNYDEYILKS